MTKLHKWAAGSTAAEQALITKTYGRGGFLPSRLTDSGKMLTRKPLTEVVEDCRALIAGLPWFMRIANREYAITDRSQMKALLKDWEDLARHNIGGSSINTLKQIFFGAKRKGRLTITPAFFKVNRARIADLQRLVADADWRNAERAAVLDNFGPDAVLLDPSSRPMGFITAAVAFRTGHALLSMYEGLRGKKPVSNARMACYRLIHELVPRMTVPQIGHHFSRCHTTVLHGIGRAKEDPEILSIYNELEPLLRPYFTAPLDSPTESASVDGAPQEDLPPGEH